MFWKKRKPEHICGGTTDNTDRNAPKVINSKEITSFKADFALSGEWIRGKDMVMCDFAVCTDENGVLTASERYLGISFKADSELLTKLQSIIDEQHLVSRNGVSRVTAGLPPEYQPCSVTVDYASGERLDFMENNDPYAEWAKQMYLVFARWFAKNGDSSMLPPEFKDQVTRFSLANKSDGLVTRYLRIKVSEEDAINGEQLLFQKSVWDSVNEKSISTELTLLPDDFYEKLTTIVNNYDLRPFDRCSVLYGTGRTLTKNENFDSHLADIQLHFEYLNGHRLYINTNDENDKMLLKPLLDELESYLDTLFES